MLLVVLCCISSCCRSVDVGRMAEGRNTVAIVPLSGKNYGTWKVQAKMALLKEGLWGIVQGTEVAPGGGNAAALAKFIGVETRLWQR